MNAVPIARFDNYVSAHIAMGRLEEDGIPCWLKDENTVTIDPILSNAVGGIKVMVDSSLAEQATSILRVLENKNKAMHPCPQCGSLNIEFISTPRKASNWASVLIGFFLTNYAMPVEKTFHCFDCAYEYTEKKTGEGE